MSWQTACWPGASLFPNSLTHLFEDYSKGSHQCFLLRLCHATKEKPRVVSKGQQLGGAVCRYELWNGNVKSSGQLAFPQVLDTLAPEEPLMFSQPQMEVQSTDSLSDWCQGCTLTSQIPSESCLGFGMVSGQADLIHYQLSAASYSSFEMYAYTAMFSDMPDWS